MIYARSPFLDWNLVAFLYTSFIACNVYSYYMNFVYPSNLTALFMFPSLSSQCTLHLLCLHSSFTCLEIMIDGICAQSYHGYIFPNVNDCSSFYQCVHGRAVVIQCQSGLLFNVATDNCDWPSNVVCASTTQAPVTAVPTTLVPSSSRPSSMAPTTPTPAGTRLKKTAIFKIKFSILEFKFY